MRRFDRVEALRLRRAGKSYRAIGEALGVSHAAIVQALKKLGDVKDILTWEDGWLYVDVGGMRHPVACIDGLEAVIFRWEDEPEDGFHVGSNGELTVVVRSEEEGRQVIEALLMIRGVAVQGKGER